MKLKFVQDAIYDGKLIFKAKEIHEVENETGFANRWIKRGIAIPFEGEKEKKEFFNPKGRPQPIVQPKPEQNLESEKDVEQDKGGSSSEDL